MVHPRPLRGGLRPPRPAPGCAWIKGLLFVGALGCGPGKGAPSGVAQDCQGGEQIARYADEDGDGYGAGAQQRACAEDPAFADRGGDCDDADAAVHPGAEERCDGRDEDCDGIADDGPGGGETWYRDADGDGFGDPGQAERRCGDTTGWVRDDQDCLDSDPAVHPGAEEVCGDLDDDDCDGLVDVGEEGLWYDDTDGDGYGYVGRSESTCEPPAGWVQDDRDCEPTDAEAHPGAEERCNDRDDNCDGVVDEGMDSDGDGARSLACADGDDCDDSDASIFPGNPDDACEDGVDADCDGADPTCGFYGSTLGSDADVHAWSTSTYASTGLLVDVGDATGDGVPDVLISSYAAGNYAGGGFVLSGTYTGQDALQGVAFTLTGARDVTYGAGRSIGVGDVDGDGFEDVGFGVPYAGTVGSLLTYGPITGDVDLTSPDAHVSCALTWCGHGGDLGDLTGDGVADLALGRYVDSDGGSLSGAVFVLYGPITGDDDLLTSGAKIVGDEASSYAGRFLYAGGDVNGDGLGELLVAAPYAAGAAGRTAGVIYVLYGPASLSDLADADARLLGAAALGESGEGANMTAGDLDGDGYDDGAVGAYATSAGSSAGTAWVQLGPLSGDYDLHSADLTVEGSTALQYLGSSVAIGDVDRDGVGELLVGAYRDATGVRDGGAAYLFLGVGPGSYGPSDADASFIGDEAGAMAGTSAVLEDVNGDGDADVVLGAPGDSTGVTYGGSVFIHYAAR